MHRKNFRFTMKFNYTTLKASNILYVEWKTKRSWNEPKTLHYCHGDYVTKNQQS